MRLRDEDIFGDLMGENIQPCPHSVSPKSVKAAASGSAQNATHAPQSAQGAQSPALPDPAALPKESPASGAESGFSTLPAQMDERELAALTRLSLSQVRTKAREGIFLRSARARYDVAESVGRYIEHLRKIAANRDAPSNDLKAEKLRLAREQADKLAIANAAARGELVEADAVTREWASILRDLRNALLAVPSRCGAALPHLTATDIATLEREIRTALEGLAHDH
ncbi:phage terminase Nu1 subunit (DNA packaging protein) [Rhodobacter viridis]|uniref:Phage terminase Nu1 subunit (DNA packaging protein) n=2 Tax=Rhodobacter viridis TaxID=1054202 RepID=A0A318U841_9RHOB|nr:phage terminase Nu1 subunit (DNA packaging protein) [Rhodobacter viridis]